VRRVNALSEHQWRMVVRTFWCIVAIAVLSVGIFAMVNAKNNSERKAEEMVCDLKAESGLYDPDC
jgi:hypothetical protein